MDRDFLDLAQLAAAHGRHGPAEQRVLIAALLRADLKRLTGPLDGRDQLLAFVDRQRQRLFAINVLAGIERGQRDGGVPMIGRADRHGFDVFPLEQLAVVFVDVRFFEMRFFGRVGILAKDVANRHDVGPVLLGSIGDRRPAASHADGAENRPVVFRFVGRSPLGEPMWQVRGGREAGRGFYELTPVERSATHDREPLSF